MLDPAVFKSLYCNITLYETDTSLRQITDTQEVLFNFKTENTENNMTASYDLGIRSKLLFNNQIVNVTTFLKITAYYPGCHRLFFVWRREIMWQSHRHEAQSVEREK